MVRRLAILAAVAATVLAGVLRATAQDATPPPTRGVLVATVAALATREAMQDRRIAALETRVALLMLADDTPAPTEPTDWPPTPATASPTATAAAPTHPPSPTRTPSPTATAAPTETPRPTASPTPVPTPRPGNRMLVGAIDLFAEWPDSMQMSDARAGGGTACSGDGGYGDLRAGTTVTVRDEHGTIIGAGTLDQGWTDDAIPAEEGTRVSCVFTFAIEVPDDREFYVIEQGRRGSLTYSRQDMDEHGWYLFLTLGL